MSDQDAIEGRPALPAGEDVVRLPLAPVGGPERMRRIAILAAIALHLALAVWIFFPASAPPPPPRAIKVALVEEPPPQPKPPQPKPPAQPKPPPPKPPPTPPAVPFRMSGPDQKTTAAPSGAPASANGTADAPPPPSAAAKAPPTPLPAPPVPTAEAPHPDSAAAAAAPPAPKPPQPTPHKPGKPAPPRRPTPLKTARNFRQTKLPDAMPGERDLRGDAYLNAIMEAVTRHQVYPEIARPLGLAPGPAVFRVDIDRAGNLLGIRLLQSSGADVIDRALAEAVRRSVPFPPVPPDIPGRIISLIAQLRFPDR